MTIEDLKGIAIAAARIIESATIGARPQAFGSSVRSDGYSGSTRPWELVRVEAAHIGFGSCAPPE